MELSTMYVTQVGIALAFHLLLIHCCSLHHSLHACACSCIHPYISRRYCTPVRWIISQNSLRISRILINASLMPEKKYNQNEPQRQKKTRNTCNIYRLCHVVNVFTGEPRERGRQRMPLGKQRCRRQRLEIGTRSRTQRRQRPRREQEGNCETSSSPRR